MIKTTQHQLKNQGVNVISYIPYLHTEEADNAGNHVTLGASLYMFTKNLCTKNPCTLCILSAKFPLNMLSGGQVDSNLEQTFCWFDWLILGLTRRRYTGNEARRSTGVRINFETWGSLSSTKLQYRSRVPGRNALLSILELQRMWEFEEARLVWSKLTKPLDKW